MVSRKSDSSVRFEAASRYSELRALDVAALPALTEAVIDVTVRLALQDEYFDKKKGPGVGDRHTQAFMQKLNKIIREQWGERVKVEQRVGDHLSSNIDYYIPEDGTVLEIAMSSRNPNTEVEKDIFKALIGQECGLNVSRLVIVGKSGTVKRWNNPAGLATRDFARRRLGLPVLVREFSEGRLRLGTALAEISRKAGLTNADIEALEQSIEQVRDKRPAEPMKFD